MYMAVKDQIKQHDHTLLDRMSFREASSCCSKFCRSFKLNESRSSPMQCLQNIIRIHYKQQTLQQKTRHDLIQIPRTSDHIYMFLLMIPFQKLNLGLQLSVFQRPIFLQNGFSLVHTQLDHHRIKKRFRFGYNNFDSLNHITVQILYYMHTDDSELLASKRLSAYEYRSYRSRIFSMLSLMEAYNQHQWQLVYKKIFTLNLLNCLYILFIY